MNLTIEFESNIIFNYMLISNQISVYKVAIFPCEKIEYMNVINPLFYNIVIVIAI